MARHGSLAEQLSSIKEYHNRPTVKPRQPVQTNWEVTPSAPVNPEDIAGLHMEREIRFRPSISEIMRQVMEGETIRNSAGAIIAIGTLRFSDGTQTEKAFVSGIDGKVSEKPVRMPLGAMLNCKEPQERPLGPSGANPGESNAWFAARFKVDAPRYRKLTRAKPKNPRPVPRSLAYDDLAAAIANTAAMPPVRVCPPSLPCGAAVVADSFIGMRITPKSSGGSIAWQDMSSIMAEREEWLEVERALSEEDKIDLVKLQSARNLTHFGQSAGFSTARSGKKRLFDLAEKIKNTKD